MLARTRGLRALTVVMTLGLVAGAQAQQGGFTPEVMAKLQSVSTAEISPDGSTIAYVMSVPRIPMADDDGPNRSQLHVVDVASGQSRAFITSPEGVRGVHWTPDGTGIAFLAKRAGDDHTCLYIIPLGGGEARRAVSLGDRSISGYQFSADGSHVVLRATEPEPKARKDEKGKGFVQEIYEEDWRRSEVWVARPFGEGKPRRIELDGHVYDAVWSPSGKSLAVSLSPTALVDDQYMQQRVWLVDVATGSVNLRIENPGKLGPVVWSPDESQIAMVAAQELHDGIAGRLLLASTSTGKLRNRLLGYEGDVHQAEWREDGIYLSTSQGVETAVEKVGAEGPVENVIAPGGPVYRGMSMSKDGGSYAFVASTGSHPDEVFVAQAGGALRRLTNSNPWLDSITLGSQEVIRYRSRDNEWEIESLLLKPVGYEEGKTYPLVVIVHGGPESHFSNGWNTSYGRHGQMLASRGYLVLYPNYRGSTGRGIDFIKASLGDPAGKEFDDVVDGVDHLIKAGMADADKVGVTGGSYGGYATGWMATKYSKRFAAGVMFVGISNKISKVGTTDIPNEEFCVHALKRPWEDWDFFLRRSPIYYADQQETPLLILHGKDDPRVDPGQSKELYRHCKLRGKAPVRLVLYPGEGHGNRKAAAKYDYSLRTLRWFDHYLKGPGGEPPAYEVDYSALKTKEVTAGN